MADAEAIGEAVTRLTMRFVPIAVCDNEQLEAICQAHPICQRLLSIPGVGP
jgi:hypothetical protein